MDTQFDTSNNKWNPFHIVDQDGKPNWRSIKGILLATIALLILLTLNSMYLYTPRSTPISPRPTIAIPPTITLVLTITPTSTQAFTPTPSIRTQPRVSSTPQL